MSNNFWKIFDAHLWTPEKKTVSQNMLTGQLYGATGKSLAVISLSIQLPSKMCCSSWRNLLKNCVLYLKLGVRLSGRINNQRLKWLATSWWLCSAVNCRFIYFILFIYLLHFILILQTFFKLATIREKKSREKCKILLN